MITLQTIQQFFPEWMRSNAHYGKHILKEYIQLMVLDYISTLPSARQLVFIGGTHLRIIKHIDRFSEDLDFDCKGLTPEAFSLLAVDVVQFLKRNGIPAEIRDKPSTKRTAYQKNIYFPEFLFKMKLTGHKDERFLLKLEAQDQSIDYLPEMATVAGCGFLFSFPVPSDAVLCSMKLSALLARAKGRDFYDVIFLLSQTAPDYKFLEKRCGIASLIKLKKALRTLLKNVDLSKKQKDFEHLLFNRDNSQKILLFSQFIDRLK